MTLPGVPADLAAAVADRYEVRRVLGRGGMATVYLAWDRKHQREVAIKVLRPDLAAWIGSERFLKEIQIAARLTHPHILGLHDSGEAAAFLYYVMPYIEGDEAALAEAIEQAADIEGAIGAEPPAAEDAEAALRGQPAELVAELDEPLYTEADAARVDDRFATVAYGDEVEVAPGVLATFLDAGHILGSAIIRLRVRDVGRGGGDEERVIVFSGDLGRPGTPIIRDPTIVHRADYVVVESTYGGRAHEPQADAVRALADAVRAVAERDGVLLIPAFAIGRTHEIVWVLDRLIETGRIPLIPLYLDSPMASEASGIYRRHVDCYDAPTRRLLCLPADTFVWPFRFTAVVVREADGWRFCQMQFSFATTRAPDVRLESAT